MPIVIENLSYTYNPKAAFKKVALSNINLRIEDGDFFGIIGHTGSGKSTLIGHLNGLVKLSSGKITVDDIDLGGKYDYKKLRSKVGMLFQYPEHQLFDETVKRDVGFGCRNLGISAEETEIRVKNAIELVGLDYDEIAERSPFELSGGQMRRVALAGVLAMRPTVLVLDEPTAGLDPRGKKQVLSLIHEIKKECPTVIMISHNMDEIFENCNKIALLGGGTLKGVFTPSQLYQNSDLVRESGLEMPTAFALAHSLNSRGYEIKNIEGEDDLIAQIAAEYKAGRGGNKAGGTMKTKQANKNGQIISEQSISGLNTNLKTNAQNNNLHNNGQNNVQNNNLNNISNNNLQNNEQNNVQNNAQNKNEQNISVKNTNIQNTNGRRDS